MTFTEWIEGECVRRRMRRSAIHRDLSARLTEAGTPISVQTISACDRGQKLKIYAKAEALSELTGGMVSIEELCKQ